MEDRAIFMEPLTRRERVILLHLIDERSNQEIADLETLALSSVKWYVQQVCAKLGVNKRGEAVERARQLGLLGAAPAVQATPVPGLHPRHNLPEQLTSFIGREKEIGEVRRLLVQADTRLLTLTGSGGIGKTRLALQAAQGLQDSFPAGIWLVELAALPDPLLVPQTVLAALGQVELQEQIAATQLAGYLRKKRLLLILDNCEHLVDACAELAGTLLQVAAGLTVLATSRDLLGVAGEIGYRLPSLGMPDPRSQPSPVELARYDAVRLFIVRAQGIAPGFTLSADNAAAVAQIVRRLDGIPLALELAAARLRLLSPRQITERLDNAFKLLTGGSRTALPRHQTLTALIDWSYNLLSQEERSALRALSVFAGGWTLRGAEAVCSNQQDVLDLLGKLADKSLVLAEAESNGEMRFRMLEMVRQYAYMRMVDAGEAEAVHRRHLHYYLGLAEQLEGKLRGREQIATLDQLWGELDNLRQAMEWGLENEVESELRLATALRWFWHIRCHWGEGIAWLERGLRAQISPSQTPLSVSRAAVRAKAQSILGFHVMIRDNPISTKAQPILEEALTFYLKSAEDHREELAWTLAWLGGCAVSEGNLLQTRHWAEEALGLFREISDSYGIATCLQLLGECELDPGRQKAIYQQQLAISEASEDIEAIATALNHIGGVGFFDGDYAGAHRAFESSRQHYQRVGNPNMAARNGLLLAIVVHLDGKVDLAALRLEEALGEYREMGNDIQSAFCLFWKCVIGFSRGLYGFVADQIEEVDCLAGKIGDPLLLADVFYYRARLSRLLGDLDAARRYAEEGLDLRRKVGHASILERLEQGHLALLCGDTASANRLMREGFQSLVRWRQAFWASYYLDGFGLMAMHEGRLERAALLFGTRLWRGFWHTLSPIERTEREAVFAELRIGLGEERFEQLREEGHAMNFTQVLALAQE